MRHTDHKAERNDESRYKLTLKLSYHILKVLTRFLAPYRGQKSLRFRPDPTWKRREEEGYGKAKICG